MDDTRFYDVEPSLENYWRAIILFGRNVASYKFALAKSLYDLKATPNTLVKLEDIAPLFATHIAEHLKNCDKQITSSQSKFLDACRSFNAQKISKENLVNETVKLGFVNVIDAFHNVSDKEIPRFFIDERKINGGIRITDNFFKLAEKPVFLDLNIETESRWRLVETAWSLNLPTRVIEISYGEDDKLLHTVNKDNRRISITRSRDALNGYQKGRCFYCFRNISVSEFSDDLADVDHFFPHVLKECAEGKPINGVANLVLACKDCNRGVAGKFDQIPSVELLERLHRRNEYLIKSHHPLRETLMLQTGVKEGERQAFLQEAYQCAVTHRVARWQPEVSGMSVF